MAKKKKRKSHQQFSLPVIIFAAFSLLLVGFWVIFTSLSSQTIPGSILGRNLTRKPDAAKNQPVSTPSGKKNDTPKPAFTPTPSGNQLKVPILMYHYVGNNPNQADRQRDILSIAPNKFDDQMKYLHDNRYNTISLDTLYAALKKQVTLPTRAIVLTFDDGYIDFYINAFPILRKYGLHATAFIPTGLMGQGYYLSWQQIKEMQSSGLITYGAHSVHHYYLPSLSQGEALKELQESKKVLQNFLGVPVNFMAYPYGAVSGEVIGLVKQAGYIGAAGTWPGDIQSEGTIYYMPRLRVSGAIDIATFSKLF